jgi:hypothetical protein
MNIKNALLISFVAILLCFAASPAQAQTWPFLWSTNILCSPSNFTVPGYGCYVGAVIPAEGLGIARVSGYALCLSGAETYINQGVFAEGCVLPTLIFSDISKGGNIGYYEYPENIFVYAESMEGASAIYYYVNGQYFENYAATQVSDCYDDAVRSFTPPDQPC